MKEEPVFSVLTSKTIGYNATCSDNSWMGACGDYCPAGTFDGVTYYRNGGWSMWRDNGYWLVLDTMSVDPPQFSIQSDSSTPPLTGWSNGGVLTQTTCA